MANTQYFIKNGRSNSFYGADGTWYQKKTILANPSVLCKFGSVDEARNAAKPLYGKGVSISACKGGILKNYLGLSDTAWQTFLTRVPTVLYPRSSGMGACLTASEVAPDPPPTDNTPSETAEPSLEPVLASKAVTREGCETELIQKTVDVLHQLQELAGMLEDVNSNHRDRLKEIEKAILDELHFAEFMELDIQRAYRSYRRVHDLRVRRRQIKNEMIVSNLICTRFGTIPESLLADVAKTLQCIEGLKTRLYTPRVTWPVEDDVVNCSKTAEGDDLDDEH